MKSVFITLLTLGFTLGGCGAERHDAGPVHDGKNPVNQGDQGKGGNASWFPLKVGYKWTYETEITGASACMEGEHVVEVVREHEAGQKDYFVTQGSPCLDNMVVYYHVGRDAIEALAQGTFLESPKKGHSWKWATGTMVWKESIGEITVPAGTYKNCWKRVFENNLGPGSSDVFCKGVGVVQSEGQGYVAKLKDVNF